MIKVINHPQVCEESLKQLLQIFHTVANVVLVKQKYSKQNKLQYFSKLH